MLCEVEFLPVGDASCAGDAIVVRYGEEHNHEIMVIDGGTAESGEDMVQHLRYHYGAGVTLAHVVVTHSDRDHASGIREVLKEIPVKHVWLHIPWLLAADAVPLFKDKTWTAATLAKAIEKEYSIIAEIVELAQAAGTQIHYPFQGERIGPFTVLSPSKRTYLYLLPQFDKTPDADYEAIQGANMWIGKASLLKSILAKAAAVTKWITDTWHGEQLRDGGQTSASNESSVVLYAAVEDHRILLTADAGVNALTWAKNFAEKLGCRLRQFTFVQIPHHGSRSNVGPTILNELIGPIQPVGNQSNFSAFVSVPTDDARHPRKIVLNAFIRRGAAVLKTEGGKKVYYGGFAPRKGYGPVTPVAFASSVEDYDS